MILTLKQLHGVFGKTREKLSPANPIDDVAFIRLEMEIEAGSVNWFLFHFGLVFLVLPSITLPAHQISRGRHVLWMVLILLICRTKCD